MPTCRKLASRPARASWLALLSLLGFLSSIGSSLAAPPPLPPFGFDHLLHDSKVAASVVDLPSCTTCHTLDPTSRPQRPGHAACFTSSCHTPEGAASVCQACHAPAPKASKARAFYPPYAVSPDFGLVFPHDRHTDSASPTCASCHPAPDDPGQNVKAPAKTPAHARCAPCHTQPGLSQWTMDACTSCHTPTAGRQVWPALRQGPYGVGKSFSHQKHLGLAGADTQRCQPCHANVTTATGEAIPSPPMSSCEGCHDGKAAFAALGNACRRCHTSEDPRALPSFAKALPYSHATHVTRGMTLSCDACHALAKDGAPRPAAQDHSPCSDKDCHASEFRSLAPRICGACHVGSEPWRALRADAPRRTLTEFGVDFSHRSHAAKKDRARDCSLCHTGIRGGPDRRLGHGHRACSGEGCHGDGPVQPELTQCASCHTAALLAARDQGQAERPWSVAHFSHLGNHAVHKNGTALACDLCHTGVDNTTTVAAIPSPGKSACRPCHDGSIAFKMTGHGCARCHGK